MPANTPDNITTDQLGSITYVKRRETRLPSVRSHLLRAFGIMVVSASLTALGFHLLGNPEDAQSVGEVGIEPIPLPAAADSLDGDSEALPDLLQEVPEGTNPTEAIDALGNPVTPSTNSELVGSENNPPVETLASIQPAVPKTILIDGKPIGGVNAFPSSALPRAPFADLVRKGPFGNVPIISQTGKKAVTSYARPFQAAPQKRQVAIVIGGLGIDRNLTRRIIQETPPEVTLSFAAHANGLQTWIHQARDKGHEVILELPMEGQSFDPEGLGASHTLRSDVSAATNIRKLDWLMGRAQGYFAVTNYNGEKLISRGDSLAPILAHLSDAGLGLIYDGSSFSQTISAQSAASNLPYRTAFTIIDIESGLTNINSELARLESASQANNPQIGVGFALPETLLAVKNWVGSLDAKGIELAPASYVLNR